ncbi:RNA polymerase subunit sigma-24 [Clostridium carboxidivorans P7]|uniref:RNA polymerase, sigma-24 subunit, ECF subfamily n=1 Tax=Clostridium carboxidivorans P7 TaxID=536227 RepID=C6Q1W4_9CLOT|nr:sigma-70 family RNA polymerase sigma factor [Clostridium carboxidivorans]AKN32251.1 RNA polymerase subunit sigma-24 [Clostridium carboxidivorans P7]EET84522.1 RNA polymerase, sigma-24 subunit, ECF subfamily [Clostridium carboxidivorans P7]
MINKDNFIEGLKCKDLKALDYLVDNYSDLGLKVSFSVLNNRQLSEECTNDVLLKVWDNIAFFKGSSEDFGKWFAVITKRQAIDILRREKRHSNRLELKEDLAYSNCDNVFEEVHKKLQEEALKSNLEMLDEDSKEIIVRRYLKEESLDEISANLGINKSAISNRLLRIRKKLKHVFMGGKL